MEPSSCVATRYCSIRIADTIVTEFAQIVFAIPREGEKFDLRCRGGFMPGTNPASAGGQPCPRYGKGAAGAETVAVGRSLEHLAAQMTPEARIERVRQPQEKARTYSPRSTRPR